MNQHVLLFGFGCLILLLMLPAALWMMQEMGREERLKARIRMIHGQPAVRRKAETEALLTVFKRALGALGQTIQRSGMLSTRTLTELEGTLTASGMRGGQGIGMFIGAKILGLFGLPGVMWLLVNHLGLHGMMQALLPGGSGVLGLLSPDWVLGSRRKRYLARLEQGLPDALDMLVICTQAGLGLAPAIIRVSAELQHSYREIAAEFEKTANELQMTSDSRVAILNLGQRTGLESLKRLAGTLVQTLQYGTPVTDALRVLSAEMRQEMMVKREARAARLPVMLTMPTMVFILPCVFLIAGGPAIIKVMHNFHH
jgi:tight adherence protein C